MQIFIFGVLATISVAAACTNAEERRLSEEFQHWEVIQRTTEHIRRVECQKTDSDLVKEGLSSEVIAKVRAFCAMSSDEISDELALRFRNNENSPHGSGKIYQPVYSCGWGYYVNIPNYSDLGLSWSTCTWLDPNPSCKVEGAVACLWGCTNMDPVLGWRTKNYATISDLERDLFSKGYTSGWGGGYRRSIGYGYSYNVNYSSNSGIASSEGPEPDTNFNWHAYYGGWWPSTVLSWHESC